jgi:hypothetical protein
MPEEAGRVLSVVGPTPTIVTSCRRRRVHL